MSGGNGRAFPSSASVALVCTAAAAAADTVAWSSEGNFATNLLHVSSFPAGRGSVRRVRAATLTPPAWRHADDARSSFVSSEASWTASRCLESLRLVYTINHESRRTMSPLSTNANFCHLLILSCGACSRAGTMYHSSIARRNEFGVTDSRFGRCSPMVWFSMPTTWMLTRACAPANCSCNFSPVTKRCCRSSKGCLLYTSPSPRDQRGSRMPSSA